MKAHVQIDPIDNRILAVYNVSIPGISTEVNIPDGLFDGFIANIGDYRVRNGRVEYNSEFVNERRRLENLQAFRAWRAQRLAKYDILRMAIWNGDPDPETGKQYSKITAEERDFRVKACNFTKLITANTTMEDYPEVPSRLK